MARTPLASLVRKLVIEHRAAARARLPVEALRERRALAREERLSRREWMLGAGALVGGAALAAACGSSDDSGAAAPAGPRIAIVGGGIAGLACALALRDAGVAATVYDVSKSRVGGRMVSERGADTTGCGNCHGAPTGAPSMSWSDAQVTDVYGELIDTDHTTIQDLAKRFGLSLVDALGAQPAGATETFWFDGGYYAHADADADFAAIADVLASDAEAAGWPVTYDTASAAARALDATSVRDWITAHVPGGVDSKLGKLLEVAYAMEYGADTDDQSALNLVSMLSGSEAELTVLGVSDEKFRIRGGVDQLPRAIAAQLGVGDAVKLGFELLALRAESDGTYTLSFDASGSATEIRADYVVLALPFAKLRTLDFARAGFDALKERAIREQGAGKNGKLQLQFSRRLWNESGPWGVSGGTSYSDTGYQLTWEPTRGQAGTSGILVAYNGGSAAAAMGMTHAYANQGKPEAVAAAQKFLTQVEPVFPGLGALWNGKVSCSMPHLDPRLLCSYAYYRVGQTQLFAGYEHVRQGNVFFCGEHTSLDYLGFMEGAAIEGQATAEAVLGALGVGTSVKLARRGRARRRRARR